MDVSANFVLLKDYQAFLRVEKGLRPLTCEAYLGDLRTFAEFLETRHGVLLTAVQQDVSGFLEHLRTHVLPALRERGVSETDITTMLVDNPRRFLSWRYPDAS